MRPLLFACLLVGITSAAPVPKSLKKNDDKSQLLGTWRATSEQGKTGKDIWTHTYLFEDTGHLQQWYGPTDSSNWDWTIDQERTPKKMTWVNKKDGRAFDCTYELDRDTLRLNYVGAGQPLPTGVGPKAGGNAIEMTRDTTTK